MAAHTIHHPSTHNFMCCLCLLKTHVWLFVTPWTAAHQVPLSMGILQTKILKWGARPSSRESSQLGDQTQVSCTAGGLFTHWAAREAHKSSARSPSGGSSWSSVLWCRCFQNSQRACFFCPLSPILDLFLELKAEMLIVTSCHTIHFIDDRCLNHNLVSAFT